MFVKSAKVACPQARARERMVLHMKSVYIKLNEINDVYALVNTLVSYDGEVDPGIRSLQGGRQVPCWVFSARICVSRSS